MAYSNWRDCFDPVAAAPIAKLPIMSGAAIDVLLAVHNGEKFLRAFLDSLVRQTYRDFRLVVSDNRSSDRTASIIRDYAAKFPCSPLMLSPPETVVSAHANFARVTEEAEAPYVMYADADDVWHDDKIEKTLMAMRDAEREFGTTSPILVHSDLAVVDEKLRCLHPSFWRYQFIDPRRTALNQLLLQNCVTGCTVMLNKPLWELGRPVPPEACAHDHWFALVASAFGRIAAVPASLIDYRQHGGNVTGAKRWGLRYVSNRARRLYASGGARQTLALNIDQARAFRSRFAGRLASDRASVIESFAGIRDRGVLSRRLSLIRNAYWKNGVVRNLGLLLAI